jgi:glycosyltransferase involved in cell wall biosynthesis
MYPSGVGTQTRYMIEALLESGKFSVVSLAGAMHHQDFEPKWVKKDWLTIPVKDYGDQNTVKQAISQFRPDMLWFMTDPRFYEWLWMIEDEIRPEMPMVYYHVWDNYPYPYFNGKFYASNDAVVSISRVTNNIVKEVSPEVDLYHIPHATPDHIFKPIPLEEKLKCRQMAGFAPDDFIFFWNNRNARRKQTGSLIFWFKSLLSRVDNPEKVKLLLHTDPMDPHGQPVPVLLNHLELQGNVRMTAGKVPEEELSRYYGMSDCTLNISDAEGFGLATLESLSCEVPIIVNMTGGLQEQVTDGENWFGIGIEPASKAVIGSMGVPWIYEDRISEDQFHNACLEMINKTPEERKELGQMGRKYLLDNYSFKQYGERWVKALLEINDKYGSWDTRKNYKRRWEIKEL